MGVKQVIVVRKDLMKPFDKYVGKMIAQGAHGSLGIILKMMRGNIDLSDFKPEIKDSKYTLSLEVEVGSDLDIWLRGTYTKVALAVNSEEELLNIYNKALEKGIPAVLITDNGLTKFKGIKTNTVVTIGPFN